MRNEQIKDFTRYAFPNANYTLLNNCLGDCSKGILLYNNYNDHVLHHLQKKGEE